MQKIVHKSAAQGHPPKFALQGGLLESDVQLRNRSDLGSSAKARTKSASA